MNFVSVKKFVDFLVDLNANDTTKFEEYPELVESRIHDDIRKINGFVQILISEYDRVEEKMSSTVSKNQQPKEKILIRVQYMEHVN